MTPDRLRQLQDDELEARIAELRDELFRARVKHGTGQLENTALLKKTRREIARALTVRAERRPER
ncbi:MAG: 50S ribosomal protein L29 [Myxococcota bacterium]